MAGNGGQMAEEKKQRARRTAGRQRTAKAKRKDAATKRKSEYEELIDAGFEALQEAVFRKLCEDSERIADALFEKSGSGDAQSTRMVLQFVKELLKTKGAKKVAKRPSMALRIEAEPEWQGEAIRGAAQESAAEQRENN